MGDAYQIKNPYGIYFLTFQVVGWVDVFSRRQYRDDIIESLSYCRDNKNLKLFAYVIMSNHVHAIMRSPDGILPGIVRDFKKYTARIIMDDIWKNRKESRKAWLIWNFKYHAKQNKRSKERQFWTHHNHAVELVTNEMIDSRMNYIHMNPVKAGIVRQPEDYLYSSAGVYAGMECPIQVDFV